MVMSRKMKHGNWNVCVTNGTPEDYRTTCVSLGINRYSFFERYDFPNAMVFEYVRFDEDENRETAMVVHPESNATRTVAIRCDNEKALDVARENILNRGGSILEDVYDVDCGVGLYEVPDEFGNPLGVMVIDARKSAEAIDKMKLDEDGRNE